MEKYCGKCGHKIDKKTGKCPNCTKNENNTRKNKRNKKGKSVGILLSVILLLTVVIVVVLSYLKVLHIPVLDSVFQEESKAVVAESENGDITYRPRSEQIAFDKDNNTIYFNNMLIVYTFTDLSDEKARALAASVDGEVVGKISGIINALQIRVEESDLDELTKKSEILMNSDDVLFAGYDYPIQFDKSSADSNPWSDDRNNPESDRGIEENPDGNDWWAEAIGAYTAWENAEPKETIKVGIIDSGFDTDHQDLNGKISFLDSYPDNSEGEHGTHVAGLVAANNNDIGIRGVADQAELVCVDWSPATNDKDSQDFINYLSTGEYVEITKQLIENGVKVINNSWSPRVLSKEKFTDRQCEGFSDLDFCLEYFVLDTYDDYLENIDAHARHSAINSMMIFIELFLNGKDDFIILQSAGNGYDENDIEQGFDTKRSGFFRAIDRDSYNILSEETRKSLNDKNITYERIDKHILIVGAAKKERDDKGNYQMTGFSNFGSNVDICAPGEDIYSTVENNQYKSLPGTSAACPIVAGCVALLWSCNPDLTAEEIRDKLLDSCSVVANGVGDGQGYSYPFVNIGNAITPKSLKYEMRKEYFEKKTSTGVLFITNTISYPYFLGSSETERILNKRYEDILNAYRQSNSEDIESWYQSVVEADELYKLPFYNDMDITVSYNENGYVSILEWTHDWPGGAHPYHYENGITYELKTAKEVDYSEFFVGDPYEINAFLNERAYDLGYTTYYQDKWYENSHFVLTEDGICFYFWVGDAVAREEILIPYTSKDSPVVEVKKSSGEDESDRSDILTMQEATQIVLNYFNSTSSEYGEYVVFDNETSEDDTGYNFIVRLQRKDAPPGASANVLAADAFVNKTTGELLVDGVPVNSQNSPAGELLNITDGQQLTLAGTISHESYEINAINKGEAVILNLDAPISCVLNSGDGTYQNYESLLESVQLSVNEPLSENERIQVTGTVMFAHTGHHIREVVLIDCDVVNC